MQSLNSIMALSFLQSYADVVMLYSNQEMLDAASKATAAAAAAAIREGQRGGHTSSGSGGMGDVNRYIARSVRDRGSHREWIVRQGIKTLQNRQECSREGQRVGHASSGSGGMGDVNRYIARCSHCEVLAENNVRPPHGRGSAGALWPLSLEEVASGQSRIRDLIAPRYDALDNNRPIITSGSTLIARGFPEDM
eukprot:gene20308-27064_t